MEAYQCARHSLYRRAYNELVCTTCRANSQFASITSCTSGWALFVVRAVPGVARAVPPDMTFGSACDACAAGTPGDRPA